MQIKSLDHVNVRTHRLDEMIAWYETYCGLTNGPRPNFGFGGAWLYIGDHPMVHLVEVETECASVEPKIEHFAFKATGFTGLVERFKTDNIPYNVVHVPGLPIVQVNVADPDGNHIHLDFDESEV